LGSDPRDLDGDISIHIISSNMHSISNCLNPWYAAHEDDVRSWGRDTDSPILKESFDHPFDSVYALSRDYFTAFPDRQDEMYATEAKAGIMRLAATASTGIEAQLIDLSKTVNQAIDPELPRSRRRRDIILNIDFAFGEQAEDIIHQLILLFGSNIRSVNFLGKAGALVGKRGDILVATAFIEQSLDSLIGVHQNIDAYVASLKKRLPKRGVFAGPMLTVQGTLLQNRDMLQFYRQFWRGVGLEMEGYFYHRQVEEAKETGLLPAAVISRFFYYVSDLPLKVEGGLSERLHASEGIPPLYAISREILFRILSGIE